MVDIHIEIVLDDITGPNFNILPVNQLQDIEAELTRYLKHELSRNLLTEYNKSVLNWNKKPNFKAEYYETNELGNKVLKVGPFGTNKTKWQWISDGTGPRTISAKNPSGFMRFPRNYSPKTTAAGGFGGLGIKHGPTVLARSVRHSIEPREFSKKIKQKMQKEIEKDIRNLIKKTLHG